MILSVADSAKRTKRRGTKPVLVPTVSQTTRTRLYAEAQHHPEFEGMALEAIRGYVDERLAMYLSQQPWWYGHTDDRKHQAAQRQYQARRERERERARVSMLGDQDRRKSEDGAIDTVEQVEAFVAA